MDGGSALGELAGEKFYHSLPTLNAVSVPQHGSRLDIEGGEVGSPVFVEGAVVERGNLLSRLIGRLPGRLLGGVLEVWCGN